MTRLLASPIRRFALVVLAVFSAAAAAQHPVGQGLVLPPGAARPAPHPVLLPPQVARAVDAGTRTHDGTPGPRYWQNTADYDLRARLDPDASLLVGAGTIRYTNASPDSLPRLVMRLSQNLHRPEALRNRPVYLTRGIAVTRLAVDGVAFADTTGTPREAQFIEQGTVLTAQLPAPLPPGATATLEVEWAMEVPPAGPLAVRNGSDGEVVYLGYWYPQMAVYDDVWGWDTSPYMGLGEHYAPFGRYTVALDAPADWLVWGTGRLTNEAEVLAPSARDALARAAASDDVVRVAEAGASSSALTPATGPWRTWRFDTDGPVRDVALSASAVQRWDATSVEVGGGRRTMIHAFYRPGAGDPWARAAEFAAFSVGHLSERLTPYPWPHMTVVEGIIGGGMEYPMMTVIGGPRSDQSLFSTTYHEIAHMWYPMIVQTNERAYTWVDEGLTSYHTTLGVADFFDGSAANRPRVDAWNRARHRHYALAGTGYAVAPMTHNDRFPVPSGLVADDPVQGSARVVASYSTPTVLMRALDGIFGEDRVRDAMREVTETWAFRLATPYDILNGLEAALGEDLDWLWTPILFDTWTHDHAVGAVDVTDDGVAVVVRDLGLAPFPAVVVATYADGRTERQTIPVATWLGGATEATVEFPAGDLARIDLDPGAYLPDVDRSNNGWDGLN